jgi:uncharacterized protein YycO
MTIPLDPGLGGRSIDTRALKVADIIVSTVKRSLVSAGIRALTRSPVSHSILYIGGEQIVEAVGEGVVLRFLADAIRDATLAVTYRYPGLTETQALKIRDFAGWQLDKKYNFTGIGKQAYCIVRGKVTCQTSSGTVVKRDEFFCSELILAAFERGGVTLTETEPSWSKPGDFPALALKGTLQYVGHLKA